MTDWTTEQRGTGQYADVNGLHLYFETHDPTDQASGRTLILLHGGLGSGEMFGPVIPALAASRQVVAVDLQGHGRTADIDRPLSLELMADDIAALIDHLGLEKPDLMGYSLGGGVGLFTTAKYPELGGRLVVVSAHAWRGAIAREMRAQQAHVSGAAVDCMKEPPRYQLYQ